MTLIYQALRYIWIRSVLSKCPGPSKYVVPDNKPDKAWLKTQTDLDNCHNIHRVISYHPISLSYFDFKPLFFGERRDVSVAPGMTILNHPSKLQTRFSVARHRDGWGVAVHGFGVEVEGLPVVSSFLTTKILPHLRWMGTPPSGHGSKPINYYKL